MWNICKESKVEFIYKYKGFIMQNCLLRYNAVWKIKKKIKWLQFISWNKVKRRSIKTFKMSIAFALFIKEFKFIFVLCLYSVFIVIHLKIVYFRTLKQNKNQLVTYKNIQKGLFEFCFLFKMIHYEQHIKCQTNLKSN